MDEAYIDLANFMVALAAECNGLLGFESARQLIGIAVAYWRDMDAKRRWNANSDHLIAQKKYREKC